ncbi:MAG: sucrase ferredoxin [Thermodesulfobacteriota bacterium]
MPIKNKILCTESSLNANEEMFGTATRADIWLLVEYRGHWSGSAFKDSRIPKKVKSHIQKELKSISSSRLQLIKKHDNSDDYLTLFIAVSTEKSPRLYKIKFKDYEELLSIKLKKILKSKDHLSDEKIYAICTNGEYDTCCGKFGMPVYLDVAKGPNGRQIWEVNHIGGHRFASTFVCLPHGLIYGRVTEGQAAEGIIKEYEDGEINIAHYRGRSCYEPFVQAAEFYLRLETGISEITEVSLKSVKKGDKKSNIKFETKSDEMIHKIKIRQQKNAVKVIKSCGDKNSYIPQFKLIDYSKA